MRWIWCLAVFGIVLSSGCSDQEAGSDPSPVPEEQMASEPLSPSPSVEVIPDQPVVSEVVGSPDIPQEPIRSQSAEAEQQAAVNEVVSGSETTEEVADQETGESVSMPVVDLGSGNYAKNNIIDSVIITGNGAVGSFDSGSLFFKQFIQQFSLELPSLLKSTVG